eukprot:jgi/Bigna1/85525/estExt_fgenesh1_pg.C_40291
MVNILLTTFLPALALAVGPGVRFSKDEAARYLKNFERVFDEHRNLTQLPANCSIDLRPKMPACKQQGMDWCWATGISEMAFYYGVTGANATCESVECDVVSTDLHTQCCPYNKHRGCGADGEDVKTIGKVANEYISRTFKVDGLITETQLQQTLMSGRPVMPIIMWEKGGGHALMVSGCTTVKGALGTRTEYFLHDPERTYYENVTYSRLAFYTVLQPGKWTNSIYEQVSSVQ